MQTIEAEILFRPPTDELAFLPEGPYSLPGGGFSWVAIQHGPAAMNGSLNLFDLHRRENRTVELDGRPGFAFPTDRDETFVVGMERMLQLVDAVTDVGVPISETVDREVEGTIINDGIVIPGGLIFGCKDLKFAEKKAGLYLWRSRDRKLIRLRSDQICSNGKVLLDDGGRLTLLDIDTPTKTVVAYPLDFERGELGPAKIALDLRDDSAFPDGMIGTPDGSGVIISFYNPADAPHGETRQYRLSDGRCETVWRTPGSPQATCPQLVNDAGRVKLIITTAVEHMPPDRRDKHPNAGCLFVAETDFDRVSDQPVFEIP